MCLKQQVLKQCGGNFSLAYADPSKLDMAVKAKIDNKFRTICG
jgi:hypothetical protein